MRETGFWGNEGALRCLNHGIGFRFSHGRFNHKYVFSDYACESVLRRRSVVLSMREWKS